MALDPEGLMFDGINRLAPAIERNMPASQNQIAFMDFLANEVNGGGGMPPPQEAPPFNFGNGPGLDARGLMMDSPQYQPIPTGMTGPRLLSTSNRVPINNTPPPQGLGDFAPQSPMQQPQIISPLAGGRVSTRGPADSGRAPNKLRLDNKKLTRGEYNEMVPRLEDMARSHGGRGLTIDDKLTLEREKGRQARETEGVKAKNRVELQGFKDDSSMSRLVRRLDADMEQHIAKLAQSDEQFALTLKYKYDALTAAMDRIKSQIDGAMDRTTAKTGSDERIAAQQTNERAVSNMRNAAAGLAQTVSMIADENITKTTYGLLNTASDLEQNATASFGEGPVGKGRQQMQNIVNSPTPQRSSTKVETKTDQNKTKEGKKSSGAKGYWTRGKMNGKDSWWNPVTKVLTYKDPTTNE